MAKQHEEGTGAPASRELPHRWAVDRVEEGTAAIEEDGDHMYEVPRWLLPAGTRDGDVLGAAVTKRGDGEVTVTIRVDRSPGGAGRPAAKRAKGPRSAKDPGGDIAL